MADPARTLSQRFAEAVVDAFGEELAGTDPLLRRSEHADYQANVAMGLARRIGRPPREVAEAIVSRLDVDGVCERVEVAGPGFVNVVVADDYLARELEAARADDRVGVAPADAPETVVIDYSGPNVSKELHVGHLRSTVIGDALARVLEFLGHRVIRQNHLGDWGTPFGMLIEHLVDAGGVGPDAGHTIRDLNVFYQQARAKFDGDPDFAERARRRVVELQRGDDVTLALWRRLVEESTRHFSAVYDALGVTLAPQDIRGESSYNDMLDETVAELERKGLLRLDEGALCAFPPGFSGRDGEPLPLIVRKSGGGYGYAATDLAALRYRTRALGADHLVYVVDARQSQHFAMVFAVARQAGWLDDRPRATHVAFGTILGPDGRPFRTRSGDTVRLVELLDEAAERAAGVVATKNPELDEPTRAAVARMVGIGALKYADLSNDRLKDYVFDWDRLLSFDGNTAPYLQYAHARIRSIFRRAGDAAPTARDGTCIRLGEPPERALALQLLSLDGTVHEAAGLLQPHRLCTALYDIATAFTSFYERCPVLRAGAPEQRASRLALCELTARALALGLGLLGIEAPERM